MTTTHIMSDETGQLILAQLQAISQALDDGALSNSQIDTVLADQSPTGAGFLDGGGLKRFFDGLQAQFAAISHNHSGDALTPASVAATGAVSGSSISDGTGTLAQLRESVTHIGGNVTSAYIEQDVADNFAMQFNVFGQSKNYVLSIHPTQGIYLWNRDTQSDAWHIAPQR